MSLEGSLDASVSGSDVAFTFTVENTGDDAVSMQFRDGQTFDVVVEDGGEQVWQWSEGMMFAQMLQSEELGPGETMRESVAWEGAAPGEYEARAWVTATDADCEAHASVSV